MKKYDIEYSKEAKQDLIGIKQYIKYNLQEPETAQKLIFKIRDEISNLKNNPEIYSVIDDDIIRKQEIRKLIIDNYIVFYRIKNNNIEIVRIMYGRRNWINLL
ncbi:MAG: type II toxin-antitoxin system RelE/ParE family toxin [Clostridia bacterium]|nr:type II toxin-antitoxin system RelE/ParE family toxin [Clostridia bacterium]